MPVYANCDYCGGKYLQGHLKYYRFCHKKFCANCHLKHKLPHKFHEIEDFGGFYATEVKEERKDIIREAQEHPEYIPINMTVPSTPEMILDEVVVPVRTIEPDLPSDVRIRNFDALHDVTIKEKLFHGDKPAFVEKEKAASIEESRLALDKAIKEENEMKIYIAQSIKEEEKVESPKCPKCQSKMVIEIQTEFENEKTGESTGLIPAYECHDCRHIWPILPEEQVESPKKEEEKYNRLVVTAFSYSKEKPLFMKIIPENGLNEVHKAAWSAEHYLRNFSPEVDFVVIAKMRKDEQ